MRYGYHVKTVYCAVRLSCQSSVLRGTVIMSEQCTAQYNYYVRARQGSGCVQGSVLCGTVIMSGEGTEEETGYEIVQYGYHVSSGQ